MYLAERIGTSGIVKQNLLVLTTSRSFLFHGSVRVCLCVCECLSVYNRKTWSREKNTKNLFRFNVKWFT